MGRYFYKVHTLKNINIQNLKEKFCQGIAFTYYLSGQYVIAKEFVNQAESMLHDEEICNTDELQNLNTLGFIYTNLNEYSKEIEKAKGRKN